jgi:hypothetical protein
METIFIQIAAYRDRELIPTVEDAIAQATHPKRLSFGICWQFETQEEFHYINPLKTLKNCRIESIPATQSRGVCWARSKVQKLWQGERYTLQIDSHTRFSPDWDTRLIDMLATCSGKNPLLTAYAPAYRPPRDLFDNTPTWLAPREFLESGVLTLEGVSDLRHYSTPRLGAFISANFLFADASFIQEIPYDPNIYFFGEEVLLSARAWTRGWDIYHPHRVVCWHCYDRTQERFSTHWADYQGWNSLNRVSEQRFRQILGMEPHSEDFEIFGLGKTRTLAEYEAIAGVNFHQRIIFRKQVNFQKFFNFREHINSQKDVTFPQRRKDIEVELLRYCLHTHITPTTAARIKTQLNQDIDWTYLIDTAYHHGLMPLLYHNLNTTCPDAVPPATLDRLRENFYANSLRNLSRTQELLKLLDLFHTHDIPAIPYKGAILAASVYGNLALRQFADLDILVHEQDFPKVEELLLSQKYQPHVTWDWEQSFVNSNSTIEIDIHKAITPPYFPFPLDFDHLWQRTQPLSLVGTTVVSFCPEDLLLILCIQIAKDCCENQGQLEQLIKVCDIAQVIRTYPNLNWQTLIETARRLGSLRMLYFGLLLASNLLDITIPQDILLKIKADTVALSLTNQVCQHLFGKGNHQSSFFRYLPTPINIRIQRFIFYARIREKMQHKTQYIADFLRREVMQS